MKNNLSISIVIPMYNEEKNLNRGVLDEVNDFLRTQNFDWEVLICNDASTDNSLDIAKKFAKKNKGFIVLDLPHGGKPGAVWGGIQKAKSDWVLFTDMDQSTPIGELKRLIPFFDSHDLIIGSRGSSRSGNSITRKLAAFIFLNLRRFLILKNITDTQCGFKILKTKLAKKLFPRLAYFKDTSQKSGWRVSAFDVELLFMAQKFGYKIKEVPVLWQDEDTSTTKGNKFDRLKKESIQMAKEIWRIKLNDFKGQYNEKNN